MLQCLSTYQLEQRQAADSSLDLLTGFQLADGQLRLVVLEGPAEGLGMATTVPGIARCVFVRLCICAGLRGPRETWHGVAPSQVFVTVLLVCQL